MAAISHLNEILRRGLRMTIQGTVLNDDKIFYIQVSKYFALASPTSGDGVL